MRKSINTARRRAHGGAEAMGSAVPLIAADGAPLIAQLYSSDSPPEMTVLALPGIGVPQRALRHLAAWLAKRGARCLTLDYRGMGDSRQAPGRTASLVDWARRDAVAALELAETRWAEPVVLLGHSFGGQALGLAESLQRVHAAVLIGSQFGQPRNWDGLARLKIATYWRCILPVASAVFATVPAWTGLGEPLPGGVAREWARWGRSRDWYLSFEPDAAELLRRFRRPLLAYGVTDDTLAPPRAVEAMLERFAATVPLRRVVAPSDVGLARIGHLGLLRPGGPERIWEEILTFYRGALTGIDTTDPDSSAKPADPPIESPAT